MHPARTCFVLALVTLAGCGAPAPRPDDVPAPAPRSSEPASPPVRPLVLGAGWRTPVLEALCFTADGHLVRGHLGLDVVDVETRRVVLELPQPAGGRMGGTDAWRFARSPDGARLCVVADQAPTRIYALPSGELVAELPTPPYGASAATFAPDGRLLVSDWDEAADGALLKVIDLDDGARVLAAGPACGPGGFVSEIAVSPGGRVALGGRGGVSLTDLRVAPSALLFELHPDDDVTFLAFLTEDELLVVDGDGEARMIDPRDGHVARAWEVGMGLSALFGQQLAVASRDGVITLFDLRGAQVARFEDAPVHPRALAFSCDGRRLAATCGDLTRVWDVAARRELTLSVGHTDSVGALGWSRDGRRLATATSFEVRVWTIPEGVEERAVRTGSGLSGATFEVDDRTPVPLGGSQFAPLAASLPSPDGRFGLRHQPNDPSPARIVDLASGATVAELEVGFNVIARAAAWSPDGARVAIGLSDGEVLVWTAPAGGRPVAPAAPAAVLEQTLGDAWFVPGLSGLRWTPDGRLLCAGPNDLRDPGTREVVLRLRAPGRLDAGDSTLLALSPDGALAALARSTRVRVFDLATGAQVAHVDVEDVEKEYVCDLAFTADGRRLLVLDSESLRELEVDGWREGPTVWTAPSACDLTALADGVLVEDSEGTLTRVDLSGAPPRVLPLEDGPPLLLAPLDEARLLAVGTFFVRVIDLRAGVETASWEVPEVSSAALAPGADLLALGLADGPIELRRPDGTLVARLAEDPPRLRGAGAEQLAFSADGARLASVRQGAIRVWDVASARELSPSAGHLGAITALAWTPDGARLASGGKDATIRTWSVAEGREESVASAERNEVASLTFDGPAPVERFTWDMGELHRDVPSPDGALLVRRAREGVTEALELVDARTGVVLGWLGAEGERATRAAWSQDGARLAVGTEAGRIRIWRVTPRSGR